MVSIPQTAPKINPNRRFSCAERPQKMHSTPPGACQSARFRSLCNENPYMPQHPSCARKMQVFNTFPHSSKWYWRKMQKRTISGSKNCHNSDLNFTNCKAFAKIWGNLLLKTRWKLFNFTRKTGAVAGLLHTFHGVFNLWKKRKPFTKCIGVLCGKLFASAKRRKFALQTGRRAKHFYSCSVRRGKHKSGRKILAGGK